MTQRLNYSSIAADGMKALGAVSTYIRDSGLPKALVDLVNLRVSQMNGCAYCIDLHSRDLIKHGMPVDKLLLVPVWREAEILFSQKEKAALSWAETVTRVAKTHVPDEDFAAASKHFNEKELADLTIAIGLINTYNRIAISFRTTPEAVKLFKEV
jgi:AhpD family alkylhydroperoxidase